MGEEHGSLQAVLASIRERLTALEKTQQCMLQSIQESRDQILQRLDSSGSPTNVGSPRFSPKRLSRFSNEEPSYISLKMANAPVLPPIPLRSPSPRGDDDDVSDTESVSSRDSSNRHTLVLPAFGSLRAKKKSKVRRKGFAMSTVLPTVTSARGFQHPLSDTPSAEVELEALANMSDGSQESVISDLDPEVLASLEETQESQETGVILPDGRLKQVGPADYDSVHARCGRGLARVLPTPPPRTNTPTTGPR